MMKKSILSFIFLVGMITVTLAQLSEGGVPYSFKYKLTTDIPYVKMHSFNAKSLIAEDSLDEALGIGPYRFAYAENVGYTPENSGRAEILPNGDKLWRLGITSKGAYALGVFFSEYEIPIGAILFIYSQDKSEILGAFTAGNNDESKVFPVSMIPGDSIVIEYYEPVNVDFKGKLKIGAISHDYKGAFKKEIYKETKDESLSCNVDINCSDGSAWQTEKRAVARMYWISGQYGYLCSGALVNNTDITGTPYFLTAHHCLSDSVTANAVTFYFKYEKSGCGTGSAPTTFTSSGSKLRATGATPTHYGLDFTLLELNSIPPASYNPYYAGWNKGTGAASSTVGIHHPRGDPKKISKDNQAPTTGSGNFEGYHFDASSFWSIGKWDIGVIEEGSSGSPLFDQNHRIVGDLTGSSGNLCTGTPNNGLYTKFSLAWDKYTEHNKQLECWLDSSYAGITTLNGFDPYATPKPDLMIQVASANPSNVGLLGTLSANSLLKNIGSDVAGANVVKYYISKDNKYSSDDILVETYSLSTINSNATQVLNRAITIPNDTSLVGERYLVWFVDAENVVDEAFEINNIKAAKITISKNIGIQESQSLENAVEVYPNPANDFVFIRTNDIGGKNCTISVSNILGKIVKNINTERISENVYRLDVNGVSDGMYFVNIKLGEYLITKKITILR